MRSESRYGLAAIDLGRLARFLFGGESTSKEELLLMYLIASTCKFDVGRPTFLRYCGMFETFDFTLKCGLDLEKC